ncbi:MAG: class SAM-dependent methyltransferase [Frankiales bacterium]|nr:class SAM-dependent methyltransferase [Frankiales bacterium]
MILTVGAPAAGGSCVAHAPDGRVVFVRGALPGETVRVSLTSEGSKFLRASVVEVLSPSPDRVAPPCPYFGVCGGCDWQHAAPSAQLALKTSVVRDQLSRLGGVAWDGSVTVVEPLWGWRTRSQWAEGRGFYAHRSHDVVEVGRCLISADPRPPVAEPVGSRVTVLHRRFEVAPGGFWQVHVAAPSLLVTAVLDVLKPQPGESCLDLYAGVGLFAAFLGEAVGPTGSVMAVESGKRACADAARNTDDLPWVRIRTDLVTPSSLRPVDLVVLDPPRAGAGVEVVGALARQRPRAVAYVSCDAGSLARDLRVLLDAGWALESLQAWDLYPQTEHVELLAHLTPP